MEAAAAATTRGQIEKEHIHRLHRDPALQVRKKLDARTIAMYASSYQQGVRMPPVQVAIVNGAWVVVDGWHRLAALEKLEDPSVDVEVVAESVTMEEARWLAARANLTHGLPLKARERREVFKAYVRAGKHRDRGGFRSYRQMAQDLGGSVNFTTVRNWMIKDFPRTARQIGGNDPRGQGGLREVNPEEHFGSQARQHLEAARAASRGVTDPLERGRLVEVAEQYLRELKGQEWVWPDF